MCPPAMVGRFFGLSIFEMVFEVVDISDNFGWSALLGRQRDL